MYEFIWFGIKKNKKGWYANNTTNQDRNEEWNVNFLYNLNKNS